MESAQSFLESVGRCALDGSVDGKAGTTAARARDPLPLSATATLETLAHRGFTTSSAVVTGDGKRASRLRALSRGLAGWGLVAAAIWLWVAVGVAVGVCMAVLVAAGAAWAIVHPRRGLQDRIAGTWLVPR